MIERVYNLFPTSITYIIALCNIIYVLDRNNTYRYTLHELFFSSIGEKITSNIISIFFRRINPCAK